MQTKDFLLQTKETSKGLQQIVIKCQSFLTLPQAQGTLQYTKNRALSNEALKRYQFGYFPSELELNLFSIHEKEFLVKLGILHKDKKNLTYLSSFSHHTLVFPLIDDYGYTIGLLARTINDQACVEAEQPKYKHNKLFKTAFLFGLNWAKDILPNRKSIILVEGQIDCIMAHMYGYHHTVALGSTNFTYYHAFLLKKYGVETLHVVFDNDPNGSGEKGRKKIKNRFGSLFKINDLYLPSDYKDIDLYLRHSKDTSLLLEAI